MKQFVSKKSIRLPRYKIYYFIFVIIIVLAFCFHLFIHFIFNYFDQEKFLPVFIGNSLGNLSEYSPFNWTDYFYHNVFGMSLSHEQVAGEENGFLESVFIEQLPEVVYLYNTFQTDKYKSNYFSSYSINSFVIQASFILQEYLKEYKIGSIVEEGSMVQVLKEENIPYSNSYAASRILLEKAKEKTPSLKYYFDLQVSDYERDATTVEIDGINYAKILFVVGTDNGNYQENEGFAIRLNTILEEIEPNLSRGVSLRGGVGYQGVYNQDYSGHVLLIQVGGVNNTIDEVNRSLKILAQVLFTYIQENGYEEK